MTTKRFLMSVAGCLMLWGAACSALSTGAERVARSIPPEERIAAEEGILRAACYDAELRGTKLPPEAVALCAALEAAAAADGGAAGGK